MVVQRGGFGSADRQGLLPPAVPSGFALQSNSPREDLRHSPVIGWPPGEEGENEQGSPADFFRQAEYLARLSIASFPAGFFTGALMTGGSFPGVLSGVAWAPAIGANIISARKAALKTIPNFMNPPPTSPT